MGQSLSRLREEGTGERIVYFYVTDHDGRLVGVVPTRRLLFSDASTPVGEIMVRPVVSVRESEPFGDALRALTARRLLALPVVDDSGRLTGMLDISSFTQSLIDLERREEAEELFQIAGIHIEQERSRSTIWAVRNRVPWLLCNIASGVAAAAISNYFDELLRSLVALVFFVPLVLTLAESVAMQSVTISLNRLQLAERAGEGVLRETRVGLILGLISGFIVGFIGLIWLGLYGVAGVVAGGIVVAGAIGSASGFFIPRLVHRWKLNPTVASGPVTLAVTDVAALGCYFGLSSMVLG